MTVESVVTRTDAHTGRGSKTTIHAATSPPDLAELLAAMTRREEAALSQLYDATAGKLYGLARTIVGNTADAEEIVCDTYVQAWQSASSFNPERGSVLAWLLMICRSRALDLLRQRRARADALGVAITIVDEAIEQGPEDLLCQIQEGTAVHRALAELPPLRRQLVALAFFRGMSHQEIAAAVRLPIGTVKSHLRRSLQSLRAVLDLEEPCGLHQGPSSPRTVMRRRKNARVALPAAAHAGLRAVNGCLLCIRSEISPELSLPVQPGGS